jgi:ABC-type dipeptide/oligopeptide/nickel transport system permease subunit
MDFLRRFVKHRLAVVGGIFGILILLVAIFAPLIAPHDPHSVDFESILVKPSLNHLFGTDHLGRDLLSRVLFGARVSLTVGIAAVAVSCLIGGMCGLAAGYFGRAVDIVIMRILDVVWAFPPVVLALAFVAVRGASLTAVIFAIGIVGIPSYARIVRSSVLSVKQKDFIMAARASGLGDIKIIFSHVLPNVLAPVIVVATLGSATAIMIESILSYLGLGMQPPASSWGLMISEGQRFIRTYIYFSLFPGLMIMLTVFSLNVLGDGLRDALDPKLKT